MQDSQDVAEASRLLFRALRTVRAYPVDNEISRRALADAMEALDSALPLALQLVAGRLEWQQTPVLDDRGEIPPIVASLFQDGIRRIALESDLSADEFQRFLVGLATPVDPDDLSEDYVTRLWEADLRNVRISAIDPYLDPDIEEDVLEGTPEPPPEVETSDETATVAPPPDDAFLIPSEVAEQMAADIEQAGDGTRWQDFVAASFDTIDSGVGPERVGEVVIVLETYFHLLVREGQLAEATDIVKGLRSIASETGSVPGRALERMADADRLAPLRDALETKANRPEEIQSILNYLAPASVDAVCEFLEQSTSPTSRRLYARTLGQIGDPAVPTVVERFGRSSGEARTGYTLALGALEGKVVVSTLLEALEDPDHTVRREAVRGLAAKDDARARDALLRIALDDAESTTRIVALRGLGHARRQLDYQGLLQRIQSRGYGSLPDEEKTLLFMALGAAGDEAVVTVLHGILKPGWIPGRQRREDWARAASALARLGTSRAIRVLEEFSQSRQGDLASACSAALRTVRKDNP